MLKVIIQESSEVNVKRIVVSFDMKNVKEMMFEVNLIDEVVHYLKSRKKLYRWAVFYHTVDDYCQWSISHPHYHMVLWYEPGRGSSYYFSNVPFMQFVRRKCRERSLGYIKVYDIVNVKRRLRILNCEKDGRESYQKDMSYLMNDMEEVFRSKVTNNRYMF